MNNENLKKNPDLTWDQEEIETVELLDEMHPSFDDVALYIDTINCFGDLINAAGLSPVELSKKSLTTAGFILCSTVSDINEFIECDTPDDSEDIDSALNIVRTYGELLISSGNSDAPITQKSLETMGLELMNQAKQLTNLFS